MIGRDTGSHDFTIRLVLERDRTVEFHGPADITSETSDAIVNAANSSLLGGGGVDGAIHEAGGPAILAECRQIVSRIGSLPAGQAVITSGGNLPAKYVIHTVGPVYRGGEQGEPEKLASCHRQCIRLADEHGLQSLSFPAISTGAYGYPVSEAAVIALSSTLASLDAAKSLRMIRFVLFDIATLRAYTRVVEKPGNLDWNSSYRLEKRSS
ncbi:MAG TPA: O-acetyl-ADP-ribose deacetylase [Candidatus Acidoferrum sp.]|nr:O-acetyl-ADP-ribose deacetylase [Candidatus Acidoferrum sp.]